MNQGFRKAFDAVEPTNQRILLALDTSTSMKGTSCGGINQLNCQEASAALALLWANVEPRIEIVGFTGSENSLNVSRREATTEDISRLDISADQRLDEVLAYMQRLPFGPTDCSLPARWAQTSQDDYDAIIVLTDSETWIGDTHPHEALQKYRQGTAQDVRFIVCAMAGNDFTIAEPDDPLSMDIVGFDSSTPRLMSEFLRGNL